MGMLAILYIPLVIISKIVRWTIMKSQLVDAGIGWRMVNEINNGDFEPFGLFGSWGDWGTSNTKAMFDSFNFIGMDHYIEWEVFITILFNIITFAIICNFYRNNKRVTLLENGFIYLNIAILNIFCFCMAKEPYQMIFFVLMFLAITAFKTYRAKTIALYIALIISILYSRKYFGLVLMYCGVIQYVVTRWMSKIDTSNKEGRKQLLFSIVGLLVFFGLCQYLLLTVVSVVDPATYLEMIRVNNREGAGSVSEIAPIFSTSNRALFTLDYFIKILRLMFPIELLLKGKITYVFIIVYHFMLFLFLVKSFIQHNIANSDNSQKLALYLYVAFWLCSAAFEPDFGSWIRHEGVAFPVILLLLSQNKETIKTV